MRRCTPGKSRHHYRRAQLSWQRIIPGVPCENVAGDVVVPLPIPGNIQVMTDQSGKTCCNTDSESVQIHKDKRSHIFSRDSESIEEDCTLYIRPRKSSDGMSQYGLGP